MPEDTKSVGTTLSASNLNSGTDIAHIISFSGPSIEVGEIETTDYDITDSFKTFTAGNADGGEVELTVKYDDTKHADIYGHLRTDDTWTITFNEGQTTDSKLEFSGYLSAVGYEFEDASDDGLVTNTLTIKVSGKPTYTAGTP